MAKCNSMIGTFAHAWLDRKAFLRMVTLVGCLALAAMHTGCTKSKDAVSVKGTVLVGTVKMNEGLITFEPLKGTPGPKLSSEILDGSYEIVADAGMQQGAYRVEILGMPPGVKAMAEGRMEDLHKSNFKPTSETYREITREYNFHSKLRFDAKLGLNENVDFKVDYAP